MNRRGARSFILYSRKMGGGNGLFYLIAGLVSSMLFIYMSIGHIRLPSHQSKQSFVMRNGTQFILDGKVFYVNGWNSYWLMDHAAAKSKKWTVSVMLEAGASMGFTVCRTWAFNDGGYNALQISPGVFDEQVFQALDYVIAEAGKHDVKLLLSLVNNLRAFGGKTQYVHWAWVDGIGMSSSNDSFFSDPSIKRYFKNYLKTVLTRKNTITGIEYRDDPIIFGWELMNEPRCRSDRSGVTLQKWIEEMAAYVKTIDRKHLLTVGVEGFYGPKNPKRLTENPDFWADEFGSDFIENSNVSEIDFASVHIYPDHWVLKGGFEDKLAFVSKWMRSHIEDGDLVLKKPVFFTEFGFSVLSPNFTASQRDQIFGAVYDSIYESAKGNMSGAGSLVWQLFLEGMEEFSDDFGLIAWDFNSTYQLMLTQSCRLAKLKGFHQNHPSFKDLCLPKPTI